MQKNTPDNYIEQNWEKELDIKLTAWIDAGEIDEGVWIQHEIKDFIRQALLTYGEREREELREKLSWLTRYSRPIQTNDDYSPRDTSADIVDMLKEKDVLALLTPNTTK